MFKIFEQDLIGGHRGGRRGKDEYAYWSPQLRYGSLIGEWAHSHGKCRHEDTWKKHWTQVISIQNVHCEGGGGGSPAHLGFVHGPGERGRKEKEHKMDSNVPSSLITP